MTKHPVGFEDWLTYYRIVLNVERFYVRIEDSPELEDLLRRPPWDFVVEATFVQGTDREYFDVMDRQVQHVNSAIARARAFGLDWLLHVDDDEIIHCPNGELALWEELRCAPPGVMDVHLPNVEALVPNADVVRPLVEVTRFLVDRSQFSTYSNGKSFGRLCERGLLASGVHFFKSDRGGGGQHGRTTLLSPACAVVLHYESCTFAGWLRKYADLSERHSREGLAKLPFTCYRESILAAGELRRLEQQHSSDVVAAQRVATAVYGKLKLESSYPAGSTARVTAVRDALLG